MPLGPGYCDPPGSQFPLTEWGHWHKPWLPAPRVEREMPALQALRAFAGPFLGPLSGWAMRARVGWGGAEARASSALLRVPARSHQTPPSPGFVSWMMRTDRGGKGGFCCPGGTRPQL